MNLNTTNNFKKIVLDETPLIDVRAPIEFEKGAFKNAINLPIMSDEERHIIGIKYKKSGNEEATKLGYELVKGLNKDQKLQAWIDFYLEYPETIIYCFRGGQRSRISQEWIQEVLGRDIQRIDGGFKAFRNYMIESFNPTNQNFQPIRLGGKTGSGKTPLVNSFDFSIDLEGIANHRGSSFGQHITPQPNQINFENNLAYKLIQKQDKGYSHIVFEDEGRHVGRCFIPKEFNAHCDKSPLVVVHVPFEKRAVNILNEYVVSSQKDYINTYEEELGLNKWNEYIITSINKAKKRLGDLRHQQMIDSVQTAFNHQLTTNDVSLHLDWIESFLKDYYDPMYEYQLNQNKKDIMFNGTTKEVIDYLNDLVTIR